MPELIPEELVGFLIGRFGAGGPRTEPTQKVAHLWFPGQLYPGRGSSPNSQPGVRRRCDYFDARRKNIYPWAGEVEICPRCLSAAGFLEVPDAGVVNE